MKVASRTNAGLVRQSNEDTMLIYQNRLFAVADGMGGAAAGEIASYETIEVLKIEAPTMLTMKSSAVDQALKLCAVKANLHLRTMVKKNSNFTGMGTTLVVAFLDKSGVLHVLNIGDSRLYLWREGELHKITHDHSLVADLIDEGKLTETEAFMHPQRTIITKVIGPDPTVEPDIYALRLQIDDKLLLCSDGLSDMLRDEEITDILAKFASTETAAEALLEKALNNGGRDNITFILVEIDAEEDLYSD